MQRLQDRVAVITGAASGIGLAMATRCAAAGMKLVLADIETAALQRALVQLQGQGARALAVTVDVADAASVERLADAAYQSFGAVHLVCNNAGVAAPALLQPTWQNSLEDWHWILSVKLMGVVHGLRSFVPRMLAGGDEGHIVNTASVADAVHDAVVADRYYIVPAQPEYLERIALRMADITALRNPTLPPKE